MSGRKFEDKAIRVIAASNASDAEEAYQFIKREFKTFDLIKIIELSEEGDECALGCLGTMIGYYEDSLSERVPENS